MNWVKTLQRILWEDSFDIVELFGSVNALLWGTWFLTHPHLFSLGMAYTNLAKFANVEVWAFIFLSIGLLKFLGVLSDKYIIRKWLALLATVVWTFAFILIWLANHSSILFIVVGEILGYSVWEFFRHSRRHEIRAIIRERRKKGTLI